MTSISGGQKNKDYFMQSTYERSTGQDLLSRIDTRALPVTCKKCHHYNDKPVLSISGQQVKADCALCGSYIKFMPLKRRYASLGFYSKILEWLPRMTDRELDSLQNAIDGLHTRRGHIDE